jgi:hypothetical protein
VDGDFYREPNGSTLLLKQHELPLLMERVTPDPKFREYTMANIWTLRFTVSSIEA